jgi:peptide/nickel transport system substrate-binding protein
MSDRRQIDLTRALMAEFEAAGVKRRHVLKLIATVAGGSALATLTVACGGGTTPTATAKTASSAQPTAAAAPTSASSSVTANTTPSSGAAAAPTPSGGNPAAASATSIIAASGQDISNLDPHTGHDYAIASAQKAVYDTLLRYQGNPPMLQNLLATSYTSTQDASEWTIKLDPRAVFHDGTPVKASDVAYSVGRLIRKNKGAAYMFVSIMDQNGAQVVDDHTVKFSLQIPFAPLPLILPWLFIVNEQLVKQHDVGGDEGEKWLLDHEAGSGPFTIKRWQPGDSYEFQAVNNYWWGWPKGGSLSGLIWKIVRESSSQRLSLLNGDAQMAFELSADDIGAVSSNSDLIVNSDRSFSVFAVKLNNQRGPTSDINVRKAISYAMDYDAILKVLNNRAVLLDGPLPSNLGDYHNPNLNLYRYDMDKARAALKQSTQYGNGGFELEYVYVTGLQTEEQIGLILLDKLGQMNIKVKMNPMVWPDMVARAKTPDTAPNMMGVYSGTDYADPDNFLWQAYHSSQAGFWAAASHYKNPEFDKVLEAARATADHQKRVQLYWQAQDMLVNDAVEVFGQSEFSGLTRSKKVAGYQYCPIMGYYFQPFWLQ